MNIGRVVLALALVRVAVVHAQTPVRNVPTVSQRAESLRQEGRPWHAAELLLGAAARDPYPDARFVVEGAKAELAARRYDRARSLLVARGWLEDYENGDALAVLGEAEANLGQNADAGVHLARAWRRSRGIEAALRAVRAGVAWERAGQPDSAATAYAAARAGGLGVIDPWLRLREARVVRDTAQAARLLAELPAPAAREAPAAWGRALLAAGDSLAALERLAQAGQALDVVRLALALGDSARARAALYALMARSPESDDAAAGVGVALASLPPRAAAERVALARAMRPHAAQDDARAQVERAVQEGDSSAPTLVLYGELLAAGGRNRQAASVYGIAARDSVFASLASYRRARLLMRLGDTGAPDALAAFADSYPADSAAPTALYVLGDALADRDDWSGAMRWFGLLLDRYPADARASTVRFRLAAAAMKRAFPDSAAAWFRAEVEAGGPQRLAARFWLGKLALARGDSVTARGMWALLAREDSIGYYGLRSRWGAGLPPLRIALPPEPPPAPSVTVGLARIDTLILAGLDSEAQAEVRSVLARPPVEVELLLAWSEGLAARGWGSAAVRLAWQAAQRAPNDSRVLRAIFPWPHRGAVEAEAREFNVDPVLLAALVRQESTFDLDALSPAGARGLAQLLPGTAAFTARGLDVTFDPAWITVPDFNLHLGAAHLAELLRRFSGRLEYAVAAYNAGGPTVQRWLTRLGPAADVDRFVELIPYQETRGYVRAVIRNRDLYRALYAPATD
ncbi:MAG TPA: transglycosylase SLT domain-containing protein [Gemmatimonadales bacterium]|nr:transglycosylase SLT domain-containing protein [Gemmatimonadales bacterium]